MTNRDKLLELITKNSLTRKQVADLIKRETKRPCSWRAVQSWLSDSDKVSARPCPDWAIDALKAITEKRENRKK